MTQIISIYKGKYEITMQQYENIVDLDEDIDYDLTDYPDNGISNAQMVFALSCQRLFPVGTIFICNDDGTYGKGKIYQIVLDAGNRIWQEIGNPNTAYTMTFSTSAGDYTQVGNNYTITKNIANLQTYDLISLENQDTFVNTYAGTITQSAGSITFTLNAVPNAAFTINLTVTKCINGGAL